MFQTVLLIIRGFSRFVLDFCMGCFKNLNEELKKSLVIRQIILKMFHLM